MKNIIITIIAGVLMTANIFAQTSGTLTNSTPMYDKNFGEIVPYNDVFYKFTPTENTTISIKLIYTGGVKEFSLSKYSSPTTALVPLEGENDDDAEGESENEGEEGEDVVLQVTDTVTKTYNCETNVPYLIRVTDPNASGGDFTIGLKDVTPFNVTTAIAGGSGIVSADNTYIRNSECTVSAVPADCYRFLNWTENGSEVSNDIEYTFLVENNRNLQANFEYSQYKILYYTDNWFSSTTEIYNIDCSDNKTIYITPVDSCYELDKLWVDGEETINNANQGLKAPFSMLFFV
ncbi:hypothetical protein FACS189434_12540 [Bacteroidia bacterium]|nr:hypothetical protein FACS189434_12540 [Bacteroidia bacterium]